MELLQRTLFSVCCEKNSWSGACSIAGKVRLCDSMSLCESVRKLKEQIWDVMNDLSDIGYE